MLAIVVWTLFAPALTRTVCVKVMQIQVITGFSATPVATIPPVVWTPKATHIFTPIIITYEINIVSYYFTIDSLFSRTAIQSSMHGRRSS